jgi:putative acetyltransferase
VRGARAALHIRRLYVTLAIPLRAEGQATMPVVIAEERPDTADAAQLIGELDSLLAPLYPQESRHGYSVEKLQREGVTFFVARVDGLPAGCGGVQLVGAEYGEIKRMYVRPPFRGSGLGKLILAHLADYSRKHGVEVLRLETGIHQIEAINLYQRFGFGRIAPFGPYHYDLLSLCFEKRLA